MDHSIIAIPRQTLGPIVYLAVVLSGATVAEGSPNRLVGAIVLLVSLAALALTLTLVGA